MRATVALRDRIVAFVLIRLIVMGATALTTIGALRSLGPSRARGRCRIHFDGDHNAAIEQLTGFRNHPVFQSRAGQTQRLACFDCCFRSASALELLFRHQNSAFR